ncbi:hypothetical protein CUMW_075860 [Citrus unshiu]|nr:hypothetical protein CUMW_075860 [Citrus unshiu]
MDSLALSCLILLSLPLLPFLSAANIPLGSALSSTSNNSSWISPSRDFAFGFRQLNNNSDLFLLAIWFNKIPERTIIWHANEDNHPEDQHLSLLPPTFCLKIREAKQYGMKSPTKLYEMLSCLILLVFNKSADIYIENNNGQIVQLPQWYQLSPIADHYFRATLDFDGVFTEYAYPKNSAPNQSWFTIQRLPNNICTAISDEFGSGACGFNSYCLLQNGRPFCECPPGYLFVDPTNRFSGCKPNYWQGCGPDDGSRNAEELYEIKELADVNWPLGDYERLELYNQTECETSCLHDCLCVVAVKP